jgi:hypothetical protein
MARGPAFVGRRASQARVRRRCHRAETNAAEHRFVTGEAMHPLAGNALRLAIVGLAVLRGLAEFASLQRWRLREWIAR